MKSYLCKDGRTRVAIKTDHGWSVVSYPRLVMAEKLGRPLQPCEDVHHIDGNPLNNDPDNLELLLHGKHQKQHTIQKYFDKEVICDVCKQPFLWTAKRQKSYYADLHRGRHRIISCSKNCAAKHGRAEQLGRNS